MEGQYNLKHVQESVQAYKNQEYEASAKFYISDLQEQLKNVDPNNKQKVIDDIELEYQNAYTMQFGNCAFMNAWTMVLTGLTEVIRGDIAEAKKVLQNQLDRAQEVNNSKLANFISEELKKI